MSHIVTTGKEMIYAGLMSIGVIRDITHALLQGMSHRFNKWDEIGVRS